MPSPAILYIGATVPDAPEFHGPAFSPSGSLFQKDLLESLIACGAPLHVLSQRPRRLFPLESPVWQKGGAFVIADRVRARLVPYLNLPVFRKLTVGMAVVGAARRLARQIRPAPLVLCTYNLSEPSAVFTLLAARLTGAIAVAFVCDVNVPGSLVPDSYRRRFDFALERWLIPRFDGLIVVTDQIAHDLAPHVPWIRVEGGVSSAMLAVAERRKRRARDDRFTIVAAGSLHAGNGIAEILGAMRLLPDPRYRLRIAGLGPLEPLVREAQAGDPRIEYCGSLPFEDVLQLYECADVLLNVRVTRKIDTRYYFPSKLMECLASGVPVITTCPGHVRDEFSALAFLLEDESPAALAEAIQEVSAIPREQREARGRAARAFMAEHRTWEVQARRIVEFVEALVK